MRIALFVVITLVLYPIFGEDATPPEIKAAQEKLDDAAKEYVRIVSAHIKAETAAIEPPTLGADPKRSEQEKSDAISSLLRRVRAFEIEWGRCLDDKAQKPADFEWSVCAIHAGRALRELQCAKAECIKRGYITATAVAPAQQPVGEEAKTMRAVLADGTVVEMPANRKTKPATEAAPGTPAPAVTTPKPATSKEETITLKDGRVFTGVYDGETRNMIPRGKTQKVSIKPEQIASRGPAIPDDRSEIERAQFDAKVLLDQAIAADTAVIGNMVALHYWKKGKGTKEEITAAEKAIQEKRELSRGNKLKAEMLLRAAGVFYVIIPSVPYPVIPADLDPMSNPPFVDRSVSTVFNQSKDCDEQVKSLLASLKEDEKEFADLTMRKCALSFIEIDKDLKSKRSAELTPRIMAAWTWSEEKRQLVRELRQPQP